MNPSASGIQPVLTGSDSQPHRVQNNASDKNDKKAEGQMGWGKFLLYACGGISSIVFLYYFHKAKYSLHKTEMLLLERWRQLPLYPPPGPSAAEKNSALDAHGLPDAVVNAFADWFIATDVQEATGVTRDDVLELCRELGLNDEAQAAKDFLQRGEHHLEERRRLSGAGLQESLALLARLSLPPDAEEGTSHKLGDEAVEILRRKLPVASSIISGAAALQQALQPPQPTAGSGVQPLDSRTTPADNNTLDDFKNDDEVGVDEAQQCLLETARLTRIEENLLSRLERLGSLSHAEEVRLLEVRQQRAGLAAV